MLSVPFGLCQSEACPNNYCKLKSLAMLVRGAHDMPFRRGEFGDESNKSFETLTASTHLSR